MAKFSLSSYTIRVKDKTNNSYVPIDLFDGKDDLFNIINSYLSDPSTNSSLNSKQRKLLSVSKIFSKDRALNGIIETGEYGYESKMYNIKTDSTSYNRQTHDAEMLPFYFLINLPKNTDEGVLILQRFKQFGIRKHFLEVLNTNFSLKYPSFRIEINPLVPEYLMLVSIDLLG